MPGFSSMDQFIQEISQNGKFIRTDWQKSMLPTTAAVAGEWSFLGRGAGNPGSATIFNTGTNLTWQQLSDTSTTASPIQHGGNVSPSYKSLVNMSAFTAVATTAPCVLMLVDLLGFYRVTSVTTTTAQTTTNTLVAFSNFTANAGTDTLTHTNINLLNLSTVQVSSTTTLPAGLSAATNYFVIKVTDLTCKLATSYANAVAGTAIDITDAGTGTHTINTLLPRYTNGEGVMSFMFNNNAVAMGAATPSLSLSSYTNSVAVAGKATPATLPIGKTSAADGLILYSGTGAGKFGPFVPNAQGDRGVRSIESVQISVSYVSGEFSVGLAKPIVTMPITTLGVAAERDLLNQMPSLPRIYDGACLLWMIYHGAATPVNSALYGHMDFGWS
jgi:hypothetical protein